MINQSRRKLPDIVGLRWTSLYRFAFHVEGTVGYITVILLRVIVLRLQYVKTLGLEKLAERGDALFDVASKAPY
jgi:hypothetical protein